MKKNTKSKFFHKKLHRIPNRKDFIFVNLIYVFLIFIITSIISPVYTSNIFLILIFLGSLYLGIITITNSSFNVVVKNIEKENATIYSNNALYFESQESYKNLKPRLIGLRERIIRNETKIIVKKITEKKRIILTGEAGSGKSDIGSRVFETFSLQGYAVILLDARKFAGIHHYKDISQKLGLKDEFVECLIQLEKENKTLLIIDQIDSIVNTDGANTLITLAIECAKHQEIDILLISRHNDTEKDLLRTIFEADFEEIRSGEIDEDTIIKTLSVFGVIHPTRKVLLLSKNILFLDLICAVVSQNDETELNSIDDQIELWEKYLETILVKIFISTSIDKATILAKIQDMAREGLKSIDRSFVLSSFDEIHRIFFSQGIIYKSVDSSRRYSFRIDTFQDFLFARYAADNGFSIGKIQNEIHPFFISFIIVIFERILEKDYPERHLEFIREAFRD